VRLFAAGMLRVRRRQQVMVPVRIDLNRAPLGDLLALPGIGRVRAEAIILHRVRHGPFRRVEELGGVDGIGPQTVAGLAPFAVVHPDHGLATGR
jgi:competence ComEA-like helix-hairpin-helix protein